MSAAPTVKTIVEVTIGDPHRALTIVIGVRHHGSDDHHRAQTHRHPDAIPLRGLRHDKDGATTTGAGINSKTAHGMTTLIVVIMAVATDTPASWPLVGP
jgi:hypothetical protein